eukprot:4427135-Pleurochrysis_carterae.AAC.2
MSERVCARALGACDAFVFVRCVRVRAYKRVCVSERASGRMETARRDPTCTGEYRRAGSSSTGKRVHEWRECVRKRLCVRKSAW